MQCRNASGRFASCGLRGLDATLSRGWRPEARGTPPYTIELSVGGCVVVELKGSYRTMHGALDALERVKIREIQCGRTAPPTSGRVVDATGNTVYTIAL